METRTFDLSAPDGRMPVYEAKPDGDARAAVIVIQEAFGVTEHIQDVTRRFAAEGYHAIAPAMFHRTGSPLLGYGDYPKVAPHLHALDDDGIVRDVDAVLTHLRGSGWSDASIGTVGFCFGGRVTFLTSVRRAIGAGVGFYGGGIVTARMPQFASLIGEAGSLKTPWLGFFGDDDPSIPVEDVEALRGALEPASVDHEIVRYAGAGHAFFRDVGESYREAAAKDAWTRTLDWFAQHLRAP